MPSSKRVPENNVNSAQAAKRSKIAEPPKLEPKRSLYVNNLNDKIKMQTLRENLYLLFSTFAEVLQVTVSKATRGQAFIVLKSVDEANLAMISLQEEPFFGKPLRIQFAKKDSLLVLQGVDSQS
ncbi:LANO_0H20230g1_1 [Lachancea nothofagi CBS 11611]|uniref:LANO_0H20230g1_1 n=1 Tax=Lachancea nothofagi CBS 11611 TaxID=1266666 RepID=A0A1G4KN82_9SACH|nr:LANO_0H20230g1_1 [Lachancea nothofagi CBS 11611]